MDTLEYRQLISSLDGQLEKVKKEADLKQRKEQLEQHVKLVVHQIGSFETRKAEFEKYGVKAQEVDIDAILKRLRKEKEALEAQLISLQETPPASPVSESELRLSAEDRKDNDALIDEIMNINAKVMPAVERWLLFEVWAIRWRIIRERAGKNGDAGPMKFCYARIREAMDQNPDQGWFIDALDKSKGGLGFNWKARLEAAQKKLEEAVAARVKEREQEETELQWIRDLEATIELYRADPHEPHYKNLCHAIRQAARLEYLRDEIAEKVSEFRIGLEPEFSFLWANGKQEEPEPASETQVTNREIVRRILARLKNKGCIGGSHAPMEKMYQGFPGHDYARAKEGLDILIRNGVVRMKNTGIGQRVSLEPGMVARIDAFFQGKDLGVKVVDEWCRKEES